MSSQAFERIDGPPPVPVKYGLLQAAVQPAAGVRFVTEPDDRWLNGAEVWPFPTSPGATFASCGLGSEAGTKDYGPEGDNPRFHPFTAYVPITCRSWQVPDQAAFKARAAEVLDVISSGIVANELLTGHRVPANPHLADGEGTFPAGDTPVSIVEGLSLLEREIAASRRLGLIHISPQIAVAASAAHIFLDVKTGVLRTFVGNVVIPDQGYADGATPPGHAAPTGTQEWIFATGPIDVRRSGIFTMPENLSEALDRGTGATVDRPNTITYRAEQYFMYDWDVAVQAAVLVDRCQTTCYPT